MSERFRRKTKQVQAKSMYSEISTQVDVLFGFKGDTHLEFYKGSIFRRAFLGSSCRLVPRSAQRRKVCGLQVLGNATFKVYQRGKENRVAVISAKNHKRQSVTAKPEKSQTPKVLTAIPNLYELWRLRLFSFGGYGLSLAALALVVFGATECPPRKSTRRFERKSIPTPKRYEGGDFNASRCSCRPKLVYLTRLRCKLMLVL